MNKQTVTDEIIKLHNEVKSSFEKAMRIGELLTMQKKKMKHGEWLSYVTSLPFSERTTRNYMTLHENRDKLKTANVADLSEAYEFLSKPKEVIATIVYNEEKGVTQENTSIMPALVDTGHYSFKSDVAQEGQVVQSYSITSQLKDHIEDLVDEVETTEVRHIVREDYKLIKYHSSRLIHALEKLYSALPREKTDIVFFS